MSEEDVPKARLSPRLPGNFSALGMFAEQLIDRPDLTLVVVGIVEQQKVTRYRDGSEEVTAAILRLEVINEEKDELIVRKMMARTYDRRTGQTVLPLDLEQEVRDSFGSIEPEPAEPGTDDEPPEGDPVAPPG